MFKLANNSFRGNEELERVATECLTEAIKIYLENYFIIGYENEEKETLYKKVNLSEVIDLLPSKLLCEMEESDINIGLFLQKKMAEFMNILNSKESITPDIFIEYLLYRMVITENENWIIESNKLKEMKPILKKLLEEDSREYTEDFLYFEQDENGNYIDCEGNFISKDEYNKILKEAQEDYVERSMINLTCLPNMSIDEDSYAFWDWDFSFFDDWGFESTLINMSSEPIGRMAGYEEDCIKVPDFLSNNYV